MIRKHDRDALKKDFEANKTSSKIYAHQSSRKNLLLPYIALTSLLLLALSYMLSSNAEKAASPVTAKELALPRSMLSKALTGQTRELADLHNWLRKQKWPKNLSPLQVKTKRRKKAQSPLLAQSFSAATIALALTIPGHKPGELLAIPDAMGYFREGYDPLKIAKIPFSSDRLSSDDLFALQPLCLAANYSKLSTIERYRRLGLEVDILPAPQNLQAIYESIQIISQMIGCEEKGKRLNEAAYLSANWLAQKLQGLRVEKEEIIVLEHFVNFYIPSDRYLYRRWMSENLMINSPAHSLELDFEQPISKSENSYSWSIPVDLEALHAKKPKYLVIISDCPENTQSFLQSQKRWGQLLEDTGARYTIISTGCLHSPSQLIILGLYDLVAACYTLKEI